MKKARIMAVTGGYGPWIFWATVVLGLLRLPTTHADLSHDVGSEHALGHLLAKGYLVGLDVIQNVGPFGALNYVKTYSPYSVHAVAFGLLALLGYTACLRNAVRLAETFKAKAVIVFAMIAFALDLENMIYTALFVFALQAFDRRHEAGRDLAVLIGGLCGVAFFVKGVYVFLLPVYVPAVFFLLASRDRACAGLFAASFAGAFGAAAAAAGMGVAELRLYASNALLFADVYSYALAYAPKTRRTIALVLITIAAALLVIETARGAWKAGFGAFRFVALALASAAVLYVVWKHSVVRGDDHLLRLMFFFAALGPALIAFAGARPSSPEFRRMRVAAAAGVVVCVVSGLSWDSRSRELRWPGIVFPIELASNLARLASSPSTWRAEAEAPPPSPELAALGDLVGGRRLDYFGNEPGVAILAGADYVPRPVPTRFVAVREDLSRRNAAFMRENGPELLLVTAGTIDGRLWLQDDAFSLVELLRSYERVPSPSPLPTVAGAEAMLFKRTARGTAEETAVAGTGERGRPVVVGGALGTATLECQTFRYTMLGRIVGFLYRPPTGVMHVEDATGSKRRYTYILAPGSVCFLANPFMPEFEDAARSGGRKNPNRMIAYSLTYPSSLIEPRFETKAITISLESR